MIKQPYEKHGLCSDEPCKRCVYRAMLGQNYFCDYIGSTSRMRPCPAGEGCTVFRKGKAIVGEKQKLAVKELVIKKCPMCQDTYSGTHRQVFCSACAAKRQNEIHKINDKARRDRIREASAQMVPCKLCGNDFLQFNTKVKYCPECKTLGKDRIRYQREKLEKEVSANG